jgi:hypothetical protein
MKSSLSFVLSILFFVQAQAGKVSGQVKDVKDLPLAFSSIIVKGTAKGTSANSAGYFSIELTPGSYILVAQHVGYKSVEKNVVISNEDAYVDFGLPEQQYDLGNVVVKNGEDPAYAIIRNAISKKSFYETENKKFTTEVYIKGRLQLRDYPKKFLGQKVNFEDGDTSKKKMIFLSETVARYSVEKPREKVEVVSTKVSGQSDGFGFSSPQIFSFYQNNINLGSLNPRGFISPISDNALNYYRYKFEGSFFENGIMVNRIQVIPKRRYEPLFNGYINIIEESWRIHSVQLKLYKENQMQLADTLIVEQLYVPLNNTWVIKQQTIFPSVKLLGFDGYGSFVQVFDNFDLDPVFPKKFFDNTILKFEDSANKKPQQYWDSIRPVPLIDIEIRDYQKKDSLEQAKKDPKYLDSLDRVRNKINVAALITTGQVFTNEKKKSSVYINGLLNAVSYNTVEGLTLDFNPTYTKRWDDKKRNRLSVTPELHYGFSNKHFNPNLAIGYRYGKKYFNSITISGGRKVYQIDNRNPISAYSNTIGSLLWERNFMKLYEAGVASINYTKGLGEGFTMGAAFEYQDRKPLMNTTDYKWRDLEDRDFTPNIVFAPHQASIASLNLQWQPGSKYIEFPERKINVGSAYPRLNATYTIGIKNLFSSDADFAKWRFGVSQDLNLKLAGRFSYNLAAGGFLSNKSTFLPDYTHYIGNRAAAAAPYLQSFQLMNYYAYSNTAKFYTEDNIEYHLNGLLTNKIPAFKKLNWFLVTGSNFLYINSNTLYGEVFLGLENILKVGRIDFVQSFTKNGWETSGIRFSFAGMIR